MTEKIKSAIKELKQIPQHIGEDCDGYELRALRLAINSLKAWEEVLNELNETKEHATDLVRPKILGRKIKELTDMCFDEAIRIINKKLSEVE